MNYKLMDKIVKKWLRKLKEEISDCNTFITGIIIACAIVGVIIIEFEFAKEHCSFYDTLKDWGSFFAALVALVLGLCAEKIRDLTIRRPKLKLHDSIYYEVVQTDRIQNTQNQIVQIQRKYYRLLLVNESNVLASNVQVRLEEVYVNNVKNSFIPTPLCWTHINKHSINIFPRQTVYIDFILSDLQQYGSIFFVKELLNNPSMIQINSSCKVKLSCYGENIEPIEFFLKIDYNPFQGQQFPAITISKL